MAQRGRPSGRLWAIVAGTLLVAFGATTNAMVNVFHMNSPQLALTIDPDDPVALIADAQINLAAGNLPPDGNDALMSAVRASVAQLPLNAPAFRLSGLASAANADIPMVRAQMAISERMERRDAAAQLWLIEDAVQRNDVTSALRHYDNALRIEESTRAVLYPTLTDALESPLIRERFVPYVKAPPPWLEGFLRFAISNTRQPTALADLVRQAGGFPTGSAYSSLDRELLSRLFDRGDFGVAMAHYRRIKGVNQSIPANLALSVETTDETYRPITWQAYSIEGIEPFVVSAPAGAAAVEIQSEMVAGYTGPVADRYIALKPGRYTLSAKMRAEDFGNSDQVTWRIVCAGEAQAEPLVSETLALQEAMTVNAVFTVPANCPVQQAVVSADTRVRTGYVTLVLAEVALKGGR